MFNLFPFATTAICNDAPQPWQLGFQDGAGASPIYYISLLVVRSSSSSTQYYY